MNGNLYLFLPLASTSKPRDEIRGELIHAAQEKGWEPLEGPVDLTLMFRAPRPQRLQRKRTLAVRIRSTDAPPIATLLATVGDALRNLGWKRPEQISKVTAWKAYVSEGEEAGVELLVCPLEEEWPQPRRGETDKAQLEEWARRRGLRTPEGDET